MHIKVPKYELPQRNCLEYGHMVKHGLDWTSKTWTGPLVKHGLDSKAPISKTWTGL